MFNVNGTLIIHYTNCSICPVLSGSSVACASFVTIIFKMLFADQYRSVHYKLAPVKTCEFQIADKHVSKDQQRGCIPCVNSHLQACRAVKI